MRNPLPCTQTIESSRPSATPAYSVAIVEDEAVLREELAFQLDRQGFAVATFDTAAPFYRYLATHPATVAVLDIGLEGEDGLSICSYLRAHDPLIGIVFISAHGLRDERIAGLRTGADAYLIKPIDVEELALVLTRLGERMRRAPAHSRQPPLDPAVDATWRLDPGRGYLLTPTQQRLRLSINESQLLQALLERAGQPCTHAELANALGLLAEEYDKHRLEVIISRLRARVYRLTGLRLPVAAERSLGYRFGD